MNRFVSGDKPLERRTLSNVIARKTTKTTIRTIPIMMVGMSGERNALRRGANSAAACFCDSSKKVWPNRVEPSMTVRVMSVDVVMPIHHKSKNPTGQAGIIVSRFIIFSSQQAILKTSQKIGTLSGCGWMLSGHSISSINNTFSSLTGAPKSL